VPSVRSIPPSIASLRTNRPLQLQHSPHAANKKKKKKKKKKKQLRQQTHFFFFSILNYFAMRSMRRLNCRATTGRRTWHTQRRSSRRSSRRRRCGRIRFFQLATSRSRRVRLFLSRRPRRTRPRGRRWRRHRCADCGRMSVDVDDDAAFWSTWIGGNDRFDGTVSRAFLVLVFACAIVQYVRAKQLINQNFSIILFIYFILLFYLFFCS
jgi:hypothetical protein